MFGIIASNQLTLWHSRRSEYLRDYKTFADSFDHAIDQLKTDGTTLNLLILGEFPKHDEAMSKFIHHLKGKRRRRFQEKWDKYKDEYQNIESLGTAWLAATTVILPYIDCPTDPKSLERYEKKRIEDILNLIHSFLETAKIKHWS